MRINIGDNTFKIKLAVSEKERAHGMMKKRFDDTFDGMLFLEKPGIKVHLIGITILI
jgi:uncharacterized membrane protein (UPF0127 family)